MKATPTIIRVGFLGGSHAQGRMLECVIVHSVFNVHCANNPAVLHTHIEAYPSLVSCTTL